MSKTKKNAPTQDELYVVGVGASAGGLDAITKLLSNFNGVHADFCVVVVMHLSPKYTSELTAILDKRCSWPVITVENNLQMKSRHIYVTPQNKDIHIERTELMLDSLPVKYSTAPSIDNFFTSLANARKKKAVGIVLSGYGSDGAKGITEIKKNNGFTIAQFADTAVKTQMVDMVVPPEQMFEEISQFVNNSKAIASSPPKKKSVDAIFELLEKRSGTDFSLYKPSTIMRRINHRMAGLQIGSLVDYYETIKTSPRELDFLFESVLIGVTEFFRDLKAFVSFRKQLEALIREKSIGDSIRIWSVGCASGEEPYSIAILLHEILGKDVNHHQIQIFASDIDERALNFGRKGAYKKETLENLDPDIVEKYFETDDGLRYEVSKEIKQHILFTRHDISNDPPFVKLDAIVCRNLLIYFSNDLQKQTFQIFHYSLRRQGLLFLGKSESIGVAADLFEKAHANKIYRKAEATFDYQLKFSRFRAKGEGEPSYSKRREIRNMSIVDVAKETLYHKYDHPFVIINEQGDIKQVHGSLRMYLEMSEGDMNASVFKMANTELTTILKALLVQVKKTKMPHSSHVVKFSLFDNPHYVKVKITPLIYTIGDAQYFLVAFQKIVPDEQVLELQKKLETADFVDLRIKELEEELATKNEHLQIFTEELEATNEELQTINEELQSANEELKSSNEELETSNEELQSANEELNTANHEMRLSNEALITKERELKNEKAISDRNELIYRTMAENIPNGTIGILNSKFEIEYVAGKGLEELQLGTLTGKFMPDLNPSPKEANRIEALCEETLLGKSGFLEVEYLGRYYEIQTVPLKMSPGEEIKILYLAQEVTESKIDQIKLRTALKAAKQVVFEYDFEKDVVPLNETFCELLDMADAENCSGKEILKKIHPEDLEYLKMKMPKALKTGQADFEFRLVLESGIKHLRVIANVQYDNQNNPIYAIATALDISQDKKLLYKVKESEERFKVVADSAPVTIWITDKNDKCTYINQTWLEYTGSSLEECMNDGWLKYIHPEDRRRAMQTFLTASDERQNFELEYMVQNKDGSFGWFINRAHPMTDEDGNFAGFVGCNIDITDQKEFSKKLEQKIAERTGELKTSNDELVKLNMNLEEYAHVTSHDLQEPIRKIRTFNSMLKNKINGNEAAGKLSEKIENSAARMTTLIKDVLEYSEVSDGKGRFKKVDLDDTLDKIQQDFELLINEKKARISSKKLGNLNAVPAQMYQLFSNLIKNALKFNDGHPIIKISISEVLGSDLNTSFGAETQTVYKQIAFADNGIGIDEEQTEKFFRPFKRLHSKDTYSGTGIGLALCRRITEIHNGFIEVRKNSNGGCTFTVYMPKGEKNNG